MQGVRRFAYETIDEQGDDDRQEHHKGIGEDQAITHLYSLIQGTVALAKNCLNIDPVGINLLDLLSQIHNMDIANYSIIIRELFWDCAVTDKDNRKTILLTLTIILQLLLLVFYQ